MNRDLRNFLSSPTTGHERANFSMEFKIFLIPLPISEKSIRIEPPFCSKRSRSCFPSSHLSTADENPVWPKIFEKYVSHYLATAEGVFLLGQLKKEQKNKPSRRKILWEGCLVLKSSHLRDIIFLYVIENTHGGVIWLLVIKDCSTCLLKEI